MIGFFNWRGVPQRIDPVIARSLYPLLGVAAVAATVYAVVRTATEADQIADPTLAILAVLLVIVALLTLLRVTDPVRSPVHTAGFVVTMTLVLLASVVSSASTWATANVIWDNWSPLVVGLVILCFAEFRSGRAIALATVLSAIVIGVVAALESTDMPALVSPVTAGVVASTPVVLFGVGAAVFSYRLSLDLSRAAGAASREQSALSRRVRVRLRELMRESGRDALSAELVPFLERVLARGEVTAADNAEARRISAVLRSVIITDLGLPWLERMSRARPGELVVLGAPLADSLTLEQKAALRALVTVVLAGAEPAHLELNGFGAHRSVFVRMPYSGTDAAMRIRFGTAITVMNAVFGRSSVTIADGELRMLFAYEPESSNPS